MKYVFIAILLTLASTMFAARYHSQNLDAPAKPSQESGNFTYHDHPPTGALARVLTPPPFSENPDGHVAYRLAARIRQLLYQEPCFCNCNRFANHKSLLDCFTEDHGVHCYTCQAEAIFCYERKRKRLSPAEIRSELFQDEWKKLDLEDCVRRFGERMRLATK